MGTWIKNIIRSGIKSIKKIAEINPGVWLISYNITKGWDSFLCESKGVKYDSW